MFRGIIIMNKKAKNGFVGVGLLVLAASISVLLWTVLSQPSGFSFEKQDNSLPVETAAPSPEPVKILFVGDLMFDRKIRQAAAKNGNDFIFEPLRDLFFGNDLIVANLEGPLTTNNSASVNSIPGSANNFIFTFDPSLAKTLFGQNIKLVNLGNNHILNFGQKGLESTKTYLKEAGVNYFGDPGSGGQKSFVQEFDGFKIGFVSYDQFNEPNASTTKAEIGKLKLESDLIIVYAHWGNEYVKTANAPIVSLAHSFIDAGADLIIGSHPHVIQNKEVYNGKIIYYSLGNFVFDQWFDSDVREGLAVKVLIEPQSKKLEFVETRLWLQNNGQTIIK